MHTWNLVSLFKLSKRILCNQPLIFIAMSFYVHHSTIWLLSIQFEQYQILSKKCENKNEVSHLDSNLGAHTASKIMTITFSFPFVPLKLHCTKQVGTKSALEHYCFVTLCLFSGCCNTMNTMHQLWSATMLCNRLPK